MTAFPMGYDCCCSFAVFSLVQSSLDVLWCRKCCIEVSYCMLLKNLAGFDWVGYNGWPMLKHLTDLHSMLFGILYLWVRIRK